MITIIDTGTNNLGSLLHAFKLIGAEVRVTQSKRDIRSASALVLPGVGAFGAAMARLHEHGIVDAIQRHAGERRRPMVGICLGMQLLLDGSEEYGAHQGLGLISGQVVRLKSSPEIDRVPRLGWADVDTERDHDFILPTTESRSFYFAHGFHAVCERPTSVIATTAFSGGKIAAVIGENNIIGCQFHPEKSQDAGMDFLAHLVARIVRDRPVSVAAAS
jgi:glutamine amidotransferase